MLDIRQRLSVNLQKLHRRLEDGGPPPGPHEIRRVNGLSAIIRNNAWPPPHDSAGRAMEVAPDIPVANPRKIKWRLRCLDPDMRAAYAVHWQLQELHRVSASGLCVVYSCCSWCGGVTNTSCANCEEPMCIRCDDFFSTCRKCSIITQLSDRGRQRFRELEAGGGDGEESVSSDDVSSVADSGQLSTTCNHLPSGGSSTGNSSRDMLPTRNTNEEEILIAQSLWWVAQP